MRLRSLATVLQVARRVAAALHFVPMLAVASACTTAPMASSAPSNDYLNDVRGHLMQPEPAFVSCRAADASAAAKLLDEASILSRAWRPPLGATYEYRIGPDHPPVLQVRVTYLAPGGSLEVRSDGTGVIHIIERPQPPATEDVHRLAVAMFGESRLLDDPDPSRRRPFALQVFAPDEEGTRFRVVPPDAPPQPPADWRDHARDFFGGMVSGRRVELISLHGKVDFFGPRIAGPPQPWKPSDLAHDLPGASP